MAEGPDLLREFLRLVTALTDKPPTPRRPRFDWKESEAEERARRAREARKREEDRVRSEESRRQREEEDRQRQERIAQETYERSPAGQASAAAWRAHLGTPAAQAAYADYGFEVARPLVRTERFVEEERRHAAFETGGRQAVVSVDRGDRLHAYTNNGASGLSGWVQFRLTDATGATTFDVDTDGTEHIRDPAGNLVALTIYRFISVGNRIQREGVVDHTGLADLSRFINGYPGGWIELTAPGEQVTLLALRPGGLAIYEEARAQFRARWEAEHC